MLYYVPVSRVERQIKSHSLGNTQFGLEGKPTKYNVPDNTHTTLQYTHHQMIHMHM